jgi:ectoine hydroxylase-related dioxygenase (phytanoyl-CoA dioxygenase family)
MKIFSDKFAEASAHDIVETIRRDGIYACEGAIESDAIDRVLQDIGGLNFRINSNAISPVVSNHQTYFNQFLAASRTAFDLCVSERITSICKEALGPQHRMVGKRIYETRYGNYMNFHSDVGIPCEDPRVLDGLGFIFYCSDVDDGAFEVVEGSQSWGASHLGSKEEDERLRLEHKIRRFPMPKGSYVIYNGRLLHRAEPMKTPGLKRQSFHFQVNKGVHVGEAILVNIGWLDGLSDDAKVLLGYGSPNKVEHDFPRTGPNNLLGGDVELRKYIRESLHKFVG